MLQNNNFNFIRLVAATVVLFSHQFALIGLPEPSPLPGNSWGGLAVAVFFVISGYLITESWIRDPSLWRFFIKRALRLIPALFAVSLIAALIMGPIVTIYSASEYLLDKNTWKYLSNAYLKIRYELPGVFLNNPYPKAVNGSIWTLPLEASCYGLLALLGFCRLVHKKTLILIIIISCIWWVNQYHLPGSENKANWFFYFGIFFLVGSFLNSIAINIKIFLITCVVGACSFYFGYWFIGLVLLLPITVIYLGRKSTPFICDIFKVGDISYGVYLFSFPVQQTVIHFLGPEFTYIGLASLSMFITYALAFVSWRLVEAPSLKLKNKLIR